VQPSRGPAERKSPPPPLEANNKVVACVISAGWAVALVVLLIVRDSLPAGSRWWIWTCVAGLAMGLFSLVYVPRLQRKRAAAAARRARDNGEGGQAQDDEGGQAQSAPRDSGSKTVSSTDTPGRSTRS
jgi:hypothetical protein